MKLMVQEVVFRDAVMGLVHKLAKTLVKRSRTGFMLLTEKGEVFINGTCISIRNFVYHSDKPRDLQMSFELRHNRLENRAYSVRVFSNRLEIDMHYARQNRIASESSERLVYQLKGNTFFTQIADIKFYRLPENSHWETVLEALCFLIYQDSRPFPKLVEAYQQRYYFRCKVDRKLKTLQLVGDLRSHLVVKSGPFEVKSKLVVVMRENEPVKVG